MPDTGLLCWIEVLGGLQLRLDDGDAPVSFAGREGALMALLAFCWPRALPREAVAESLWPGCETAAGRARLRVTLFSLRRRLQSFGVAEILCATRESIGLHSSLGNTDLAQFRRRLQVPDEIENALASYRPLLPDFYDEWIAPEAARLEAEYFHAVAKWIETHEFSNPQAALRLAERGLSFDALREDLTRAAMRLHARNENRNAARRAFQKLEEVLSKELNAAPENSTRALMREIESGAFDSSPRKQDAAWSTPERDDPSGVLQAARPSVLPLAWTKFFGRESELEFILQWQSQSEARLLTVSGTGGVGKTRLVLEAARAWERERENAAHADLAFVRLEGLPDATFLIETILSALPARRTLPGAPAPPPTNVTPFDAVAMRLPSRPFLLVLDNFEHLAQNGAPLLMGLLAGAPLLKILVSSRQRLHIEAEKELALSPLALPALDANAAHLAPTELANLAAIDLFVDRARLCAPGFRVSGRNALSLARLCARLDGLPLAIELAAAHAGVLSPGQMLSRLEARMDLERAASGQTEYFDDPASRHRTLRAALDWSVELLSPELRAFFASLSIFRGGWTSEACEVVCHESRALHYLAGLRAASLVVSHEAGAEVRFRLLETVRILAGEHLPLVEKLPLARRHAHYFSDFALRAAPHLPASQGDAWLDRLESEADNLRAALGWLLEHDAPRALKMCVELIEFWEGRGHNAEGCAWLERALARASWSTPGRAHALAASARLAMRTADYPLALRRGEEAVELLRGLNDKPVLARALSTLCLAHLLKNDFERTRELYQEALSLARETGDEPLLMYILNMTIMVLGSLDDFQSALVLAEENLELCRRAGSKSALLAALVTMAQTYQVLEYENSAAQKFLDEAMPLALASGPTWDHSRALWIGGNLARERSDIKAARDLYVGSLKILFLDMNDPMPVNVTLIDCAFALFSAGLWREGAVILGAAAATREANHLPILPMQAARHEAWLQSAREHLAAKEWKREWRRGRSFSSAEIVRFLENLPL